MGRSNKEGGGNRRVEVPLYQKKDGGYGAKGDLKPVSVTATKMHVAPKAPMKKKFNPGGHAVQMDVSGPHKLKSGKLYE